MIKIDTHWCGFQLGLDLLDCFWNIITNDKKRICKI